MQALATAGQRWAGPIAMIRNWTYCIFYVMAELWGSVVVSVLFWGFANQITTVKEAEDFYPLFGLGANVALIFSGQAVKYFSQVGGRAWCSGVGGRGPRACRCISERSAVGPHLNINQCNRDEGVLLG